MAQDLPFGPDLPAATLARDAADPAPDVEPGLRTEPAVATADPELGRAVTEVQGDGTSFDAMLRGIEERSGTTFTDAERDDARAALETLQARLSVDPEKVSAAVETITENLRGIPFEGKLEDAERAIADLSPAEATEAFSRLTDDQVRDWAGSAQRGVTALGYEREDTDRFYGVLAQHLDGAQLARFASALVGDHVHYAEAQRFGRIVAEQAPPEVRAQLVMASNQRAREDNAGLGVAGGEALASLSGPLLDRTLADLGDRGIASAISRAALGNTIHTRMGSSTSYNVETVAAIAETLATATDARARGVAFANAASMLGSFQNDWGYGYSVRVTGRDDLRDGVRSLLMSDAPAVTGELGQRFDTHGLALAAYLKAELDAERPGAVRDYLVALRGDTSMSTVDWMESRDAEGIFQNARNLGFGTGATRSAILGMTGDRRDQVEAIKDVFGTGAGVAGAAHPAAGVVATILTGISGGIARDIIADAERSGRDQAIVFDDLAMPRYVEGDRIPSDARAGDPYAGAAWNAYQTARGAVLDSRQ